MSEVNNDADKAPAEDSSNGEPANKGEASSSNTNIDPAEQARRDQQSKKDQAVAQASKGDDSAEALDFLLSKEMMRERDTAISNFLTENKEKYPHVTAEDLKYASSEEELVELSQHWENKYKTLQQAALSDVQGSDVELTPEQLKEAELQLEKETKESGKSTFGRWLSKRQQTKQG